MSMNHICRCASFTILSSLFSLLPSPCSPLTKLSPPVFQTLNSLSITNCVAPPRTSPPLFLFVRHWSLSVQTSAEKHSLSLFKRDERGHGERERGRERRNGSRDRQTEGDGGWDGDRMGGVPLRIWINLSLSSVGLCVLGPAERHSLIKTLGWQR